MAIRNPRTGEDEYPMVGFAAAPEIVTAVPTVTPQGPPYSFDLRYPSAQLPQNNGVIENDSALRCCHASLPPFTRLSVVLMMDSGRSTSNSRSGEPSRAPGGIACGFAFCFGVGDAFDVPLPACSPCESLIRGGAHNRCSGKLSLSAKPVKGSGVLRSSPSIAPVEG